MSKRNTTHKLAGGSILAVLLVAFGAYTAAAQTAQVQVIHNSPDPAAAAVDIYINNERALDDFAFRAATPVLDLPAGVELVIGVAPGGSTSPDDIIANFPVTLAAGEGYVVMAAGVLDGSLPGNPDGIDTAFNLFIFPGLRSAGTGSNVDLLAFHGAPDAPAVDVVAVGVGTLFGDLAFGEFDGYLSVPAANYTLNITPAGNPGTVVASFVANLTGLDGAAAVVFASGFLGARTLAGFGLFAALPDGAVVPLPVHSVSAQESSWGTVKASFR